MSFLLKEDFSRYQLWYKTLKKISYEIDWKNLQVYDLKFDV